MRTIFFLSDFGSDSIYVAACRAIALSIAPDIPLVDITHSLPPHNIEAAALMLGDIAPYLPPTSIVVAVVDPTVGSKRRIIAVETPNLVFIAPDNGLLSPFLEGSPIYSITNEALFHHPVSPTFHGRDIMVPVATRIASGTPLPTVGPRIYDAVRIALPEPLVSSGRIKGRVVMVDNFGNLITDIKEEHLLEAFGFKSPEELSKSVRLYIGSRKAKGFFKCYSEAPSDELFGIIGSFGRLEISMKAANARKQVGISIGTSVSLYIRRKD